MALNYRRVEVQTLNEAWMFGFIGDSFGRFLSGEFNVQECKRIFRTNIEKKYTRATEVGRSMQQVVAVGG